MEAYEVKWNLQTAKAKYLVDTGVCSSNIPDVIRLPAFHAPGLADQLGWSVHIEPEKPDFSQGKSKAYRFLKFVLTAEQPAAGQQQPHCVKTVVARASVEVSQTLGRSSHVDVCREAHGAVLSDESFELKYADARPCKRDASARLPLGQLAFLTRGTNVLTVRATVQYCVADGGVSCKSVVKRPPPSDPNASAVVEGVPVVKGLRTLLTTGELADATLCVGGTDLPVHRAVLAAKSAFFKEWFMAAAGIVSGVRVVLNDYSLLVVKRLLRVLYTGRVELDLEHSVEMLVAADRLGVPELRAKCEKFLADALQRAAEVAATSLELVDAGAMVCDVLRAAALLDSQPLRRVAVDYLRKHQYAVMDGASWAQLCRDYRAEAGAALLDVLTPDEEDLLEPDGDSADAEQPESEDPVEYLVKHNFHGVSAKFTLDFDTCFNDIPDSIILPRFKAPGFEDIGWVMKLQPAELTAPEGDDKPSYRMFKILLVPESLNKSVKIITRIQLHIVQRAKERIDDYCKAYDGVLTSEDLSVNTYFVTARYSAHVPIDLWKIAFMSEAGNDLSITVRIQFCYSDDDRMVFKNMTMKSPKPPKPSPLPPKQVPVLQGLRALLLAGELSDATLCVNGTDLPVHRTVLAAQSAYFKAVFQAAADQPQVRVDLTDYGLPVVRCMLRALYAGRVKVDVERAVELLAAADKLGMPGLRFVLRDYLQDAMYAHKDPNAMLCDVLRVAALLGSEQLRRVAVDHLSYNQDLVVASTAWAELCRSHRALAGAALADALSPDGDDFDYEEDEVYDSEEEDDDEVDGAEEG